MPVSRNGFKSATQEVMKLPGHKYKCASDSFIKRFRKRHPSITMRKHSQLSEASARVSSESVFSWRRRVVCEMTKLGHLGILRDPTRMINADETNVEFNGKALKCLASSQDKHFYEKMRAGGKQNRTVLVAGNVNGDFVPPFVLLPGKRLSSSIAEAARDHFRVQVTDNGWMDELTYRFWIQNILSPWARQLKIQEPFALIDDNAWCHDSPAIAELCDELNIIHIKLPPNTIHCTQPLDVGFFGQFKKHYFCILQHHKDSNTSYKVNNETFIKLMKELKTEAFKPETLKMGFKRSGLFPWDDNAVDIKKLLGTNKSDFILGHQFEEDINSSNGAFDAQNMDEFVDVSNIIDGENIR